MNFKTYLKNEGLSKTTVNHYHMHLMDFMSFLDTDNTEIENATTKEVLLYLRLLQNKGVGNITKKIRLYALKHFFNYQIENEIRIDNPAKKIKITGSQKQKITTILTKQELQAIYQNYEVPTKDHKKSHHNWFNSFRLSKERNKVIISLLIHQGLTTAEVSRIEIDDLNLRKGNIDIKGGRMGKDRTLALKSSQIIDLMEYQFKTRTELLAYQPTATKQLFLSTPSSGQTKAKGNQKLNIWKRLNEELKERNPKLIKLQHIRKSVIVNWLKQYNLREVQYKAGHRHIYSTEMYLVNDIDDLQAEINKYHPIN
jgi:integrase/recombinase XerD